MTHGEVVTDTGAVAAIVSPIWLPQLHAVSTFAATILPILGVLWLSLQIGTRLYLFYKKK